MSYTLWLEYFRSIFSLVLLSVGAIQDVRSREIDDRVWLVFLVAALALNALGVFTNSVEPVGWLVFAGLQSIMFILLYYAGVYGGADAKSLICLSFMYPSSLLGLLTDLSTGRLPIPFSTFDNAVTLTILYLPVNLFWNLSVRMKGVELFQGLEKENALRRLAALLLLRKVRFSSYRSNSVRFLLAEKRSRSGARRIVFSRKIDGGEVEQSFEEDDYVFASFLIPFQVFLFIGLVIRLLYGDVLLLLALVFVRLMLTGF
ncbi:MAG: prepilin peptidase [Thermoproteota archaeon]